MRIVCLLTVGAFLLSISIAESEMPIGAPQYQQQYRPIVLEPVLKIKPNNEANPVNWFINMVSRLVEPPKKPPPAIIGPFPLPGKAGSIFIRQLEENSMPWQKNHVVIKLPIIENTLTSDINNPSYYHRSIDPSRRAANSYGYQSPQNNYSARSKKNIFQPGFVPISPQPQYSSWHAHHQQRHQNHNPPTQQQYSKPFRPSAPNDFHYDNRDKENEQDWIKGRAEDYSHRRPYRMNHQRFNPGEPQPLHGVPMASMYHPIADKNPDPQPIHPTTSYHDQFGPTRHADIDVNRGRDVHASPGNPNFPIVTQLPYPEYPGASNNAPEPTAKPDNVSQTDITSSRPFGNSGGYYGQVVRTDRMVPAASHRNNLHRNAPRSKKTNQPGRNSHGRGFRDGTRYGTNFGVKDVGGIEVINAPNFRNVWEDYNGAGGAEDDDLRSDSKESESGEKSEDVKFVRTRNGKSLIDREESDEELGEKLKGRKEDSDASPSRKKHSRQSSYRVIDRTHRKSIERSNSTASNDDSPEIVEEKKIEDTKNFPAGNKSGTDEGAEEAAGEDSGTKSKGSNVTSEFVGKVVNQTISKNRRSQGRTPRVVKAIYRRKPVAGIIKSSGESVESGSSSGEKSSEETLSSEN